MKKTFVQEINFLRFLSILFVVVYHFFPNFVNKGYLGVDLFFVISGYLISFYIYNEVTQKKFELKNFYNRRIKRILPAVIFLLFVTTFFALIILTKVDLINYSKSLIYSLFFSSNFFFWINGGYFGPNDELKLLLHLWSLGVEEQFYIIFPILFYYLIKKFKNINFLTLIISIITFISFSFHLFLTNIGGENPAFFLLPTRIWNFGFGILAMLFFVSQKKMHNNLEIFFYITMILIGFFYHPSFLPENFIIIFFTFFFLKKKFPKKFFLDFIIRNKFFQYIGLMSFSLYLWHWPVLVFVKYYFVYDLNTISKIFALLVSILLSVFSYHLIELKFRYKIKIYYTYNILIISYVFFVLFFFYINFNNKNLYDINSPNFIADASLTNFKCEVFNYSLYQNKRGCIINRNSTSNEVFEIAIVGNSHAQMYVPSIKPHLVKYKKQAILLPMTGCLPTITVNINQKCMEIAKKYFLSYSKDKNIDIIILATTWWHQTIYDGKSFVDDPKHLILGNSILQLIENLKLKNKIVFLVGPLQVPLYELPQNLSRLLKFNHINNQELLEMLKVKKKIYDDEYSSLNLLLSENLDKNFIQVDKIQCDLNYCYYSNQDGLYFADGSHISKIGTKIFLNSFEIIFD